jgi:hypothetical protein
MPSCRFFAVGDDAHAVFEAVLADGSLQLFEQYSRPNSELRAFQTPAEAAAAFASGIHGFTLYAPACGARIAPRRFALKADTFGAGAFRYQIVGWGTLNLQFGSEARGRLHESFLNHNSEARARKWEPGGRDELGAVDAWHWPEVAQAARRVVGLIRRLGVARLGATIVLPTAHGRAERGELHLGVGAPIADGGAR